MSRGKLATVTGLTAMVLASAGFAMAPASAAVNCPSGYHCVFNSAGSRHAYFNSDPNFAGDLYADGTVVDNNVAFSINSSSLYESHYYQSAGYNGFILCVNPGSSVNWLPNQGPSSMLLRQGTTISCY